MPAMPRIVFSTFRSSSDPMFLAWARFLQSVEGSSRRTSTSGALPDAGASAAVSRGGARPGASPLTAARPRAAVAGAVAMRGTCGVWRILASNNRELGRSARAYTTFASAHAHVLALRGALDDIALTSVNGERTGMHGWYMTLGTMPVITCGRWYGAASSSAEAALATLVALRDGIVEPAARSITPPRRRDVVSDDAVW